MAKKLATSIAGGAWTQVRVNGSEIIGLAQRAAYNEDFGVQPIETLNFLGPREYESLGYTCEVTIGWLIAKNKDDFNKLAPHRADINKDGILPDNLIEFIDTATNEVHAKFRGCVVSRVSETIESNQFVAGDITLMSIERVKTTHANTGPQAS
jgi:hypothetical protein